MYNFKIGEIGICADAIKHWGATNQQIIAIEELSELQQAITKMLRIDNAAKSDKNREHLIEEIADVLISIEAVIQCNNIRDFEIAGYVNEKLSRLIKRMEEEDSKIVKEE